MAYFVGVDSGGTFTDVVILDTAGTIFFDKAFSTPHRPALGVIAALQNAVGLLPRELRTVLEETERFSHGTTVPTNAPAGMASTNPTMGFSPPGPPGRLKSQKVR